jgi:hypothetical protein
VYDFCVVLVNKAKDEGQVDGVVPHLVDGLMVAYPSSSMQMIVFYFLITILIAHET